MAEPLKHLYNEEYFKMFLNIAQSVYPSLNANDFAADIHDDNWEDKALKARMRHLSRVLKAHLPANYEDAIAIIIKMVDKIKEQHPGKALEYMFFPDFVEQYGQDYFDTSIAAFEMITTYTSCEFAVRPFIIKYPKKMMQQMLEWSRHPNHHLRRLASEGCRPRLPWAMALPLFKQNPDDILPILENLKNDPSEYVRKSVANNLNDISKDHPELVVSIAKKWKDHTKNTDWIIKHACRTLLKQGNAEVMQLHGFGSSKKIKLQNFEILTPHVNIGDYLAFRFLLQNLENKPKKIRLEYAIYYQKANGTLSKKVFMISEKEYPAQSETTILRKQSFKLISTRKFHPGLHQIGIIINGIEKNRGDFYVIKQKIS